jgi:hypothetical protein
VRTGGEKEEDIVSAREQDDEDSCWAQAAGCRRALVFSWQGKENVA